MGTARRLKIGIFFNARREQGGLYQYAVTLVDCLYKFVPEHTFYLFQATLEPVPIQINAPNWCVKPLPRAGLSFRMGLELILFQLARYGLNLPLRILPTHPEIQSSSIDLMLYVKPSLQVFLWNYPSVFPIHDLQHRLHPEFPEVAAAGEAARRDFVYNHSVSKASAILTDSEVGKEDVVKLYKADPTRIHPLPYLASAIAPALLDQTEFTTLQDRYNLPEQYFFYPAAFWSHKNHNRIIHAARILRDTKEQTISLVFSGSHRHEYQNLLNLTRELRLENCVHFIGYVPDEHLPVLYRHALALIMPTFFGPTNIPVLEAWSYDCPVITSNIRGIREQTGAAGLLVDPLNEQEIAEAMYRIISEIDLREELIRAGRERVAAWQPADFARRLEKILQSCVRPI